MTFSVYKYVICTREVEAGASHYIKYGFTVSRRIFSAPAARFRVRLSDALHNYVVQLALSNSLGVT